MIRAGNERSTPSCASTARISVQGGFACADFTPEFVKYIHIRVPELKCAQ